MEVGRGRMHITHTRSMATRGSAPSPLYSPCLLRSPTAKTGAGKKSEEKDDCMMLISEERRKDG
jgi:hypothetical protein